MINKGVMEHGNIDDLNKDRQIIIRLINNVAQRATGDEDLSLVTKPA